MCSLDRSLSVRAASLAKSAEPIHRKGEGLRFDSVMRLHVRGLADRNDQASGDIGGD